MVKGINKQVIVVNSPEEKLFEQAIFILKEDAVGREGITDAMLLQEANRWMRNGKTGKKAKAFAIGPVWAAGGAAVTALAWLITGIL